MTSLPNYYLKKEISILSVAFLFALVGITPALSQEVISTGGEYQSNLSGSISYTIGEPVIATFTEGNNVMTHGFQQSNLVVTAVDELPGLNYEISAYPNPASEMVKLRIDKNSIVGMQYMLYDMNGVLLLKNQLEGNETEISFRDLFPAEYILMISDQDKELKSFKIVKIQ